MATWRFYESIVSFPFFRQVVTHLECSGRDRPSLPWACVWCLWPSRFLRGRPSRVVVSSLGCTLESPGSFKNPSDQAAHPRLLKSESLETGTRHQYSVKLPR